MNFSNISLDLFLKTIFKNYNYNMIDISNKIDTKRIAIAYGSIVLSDKAFNLLYNNNLEKGDALLLAEVASINAIKKTSDIIILSHNILIEKISVSNFLFKENNEVFIYCMVVSNYKTGVEMEALFGVSVGLLTIYDLTKYIGFGSNIKNISLLFKDGGKNHNWFNYNSFLPNFNNNDFLSLTTTTITNSNIYSISVVTISDRSYNNIYNDISGSVLIKKILLLGYKLYNYSILPDNKLDIVNFIKKELCSDVNVIFINGGSGISNTDVTTDSLKEISSNFIPGIGEFLRFYGYKYNKFSWLSRSIAIIYNKTLIISIPGNPNAVNESIDLLSNLLLHALNLINKND